MDAVLAIIVDGGQVICKITWVAVETKLIHRYFIDSYKTPPQHPQPTPFKEVTCVGLGGSIESTLLEGQMAHHGDDICGIAALVVNRTFHTIPTIGIPQRRSFCSCQKLVAFKLLILKANYTPLWRTVEETSQGLK